MNKTTYALFRFQEPNENTGVVVASPPCNDVPLMAVAIVEELWNVNPTVVLCGGKTTLGILKGIYRAVEETLVPGGDRYYMKDNYSLFAEFAQSFGMNVPAPGGGGYRVTVPQEFSGYMLQELSNYETKEW